MIRHPKAPLVFGIVMLSALAAYITLYKSSPGELASPHLSVAGSSFIGDCNKCHADKDIAVSCLKCHGEIKGQLSSSKGFHAKMLEGKKAECAHCHSEHNGRDFPLVNKVSWGGKDYKKFKHDYADFHLVEKHDSVSCEACHKKFAKTFFLPDFPKNPRSQTYLGLSQECMSCHKDVHAGGLAADCRSCHGQTAFKPSVGFDHEKFYSLTLGHARLECKSCHVLPAPGTPLPAHPPKAFPFDKSRASSLNKTREIRCADCHKNPHRTDWKNDCESCHTKAAVPWADANLKTGRAAHALTGFRLIAPHDKVSCAKCHDPKLTFKLKYADAKTGRPRSEKECQACHRDEHRGQFAAKHPKCMDCHALSVFKPAKFTVADHGKTSYPLAGAHIKAACNACHVKDERAKTRIYAGLNKSCAYCHNDIHYGQFLIKGQNRCENCHIDTRTWKKLIFDHNTQSRYVLDSAHKDVACKECHPTVTLPNRKRTIQYKPLRMRCQDCHDVVPR